MAIQKSDLSRGSTWEEANKLCESSTAGGYNDWRLPTSMELSIISVYVEFKALGVFIGKYWSNEPYWFKDIPTSEEKNGWANANKSASYCVRCVRTTNNTVLEIPTYVRNRTENEKGVIINGVKWATRNVGKSSTFVENPEDYGEYYTWDEAKKACPKGWRLPTEEEFKSLQDVSNAWTTRNGIDGRLWDNNLFFPAGGQRIRGNVIGSIISSPTNGYYWSSTISPTFGQELLAGKYKDKHAFLPLFNINRAFFDMYASMSIGALVRCVCE